MIGAARLRGRRDSSWICGNPRDFSRDQHRFNVFSEPGWVSRLEYHVSSEVIPQNIEKRAGDRRVEGQAWRKLNEDRTKFASKSRRFRKKLVESWTDIHQLRLVGDRFRQLYGKPKIFRNRCGPPLVRGPPMRPIKTRVDLDGIEQSCVTLEMSTLYGKAVRMLPPNVPAGGAEMDRTVE